MSLPADRLDLLSTCPPRRTGSGATYLEDVVNAARWSEEAGYSAMLVYTAHASLADPFVLAQAILQQTSRLSPLVAVQPAYMHPFAAAKMVASLATLYRRRIDLNMIAGGFKGDLAALGDDVPHDERYERLVEYTSVMLALMTSAEPVSFAGRYYRIERLRLEPVISTDLLPRIFVSGSSVAGLQTASRLNAIAMHYPLPFEADGLAFPDGVKATGIRLGIIARGNEAEAWEIAERRFPEDRKGQITHMLAMSATDSLWHKRLSALAEEEADQGRKSLYWLGPFSNYQDYCPYLVGSYERVGAELSRHIGAGHRTFILNALPDAREAGHVAQAFSAAKGAGS